VTRKDSRFRHEDLNQTSYVDSRNYSGLFATKDRPYSVEVIAVCAQGGIMLDVSIAVRIARHVLSVMYATSHWKHMVAAWQCCVRWAVSDRKYIV